MAGPAALPAAAVTVTTFVRKPSGTVAVNRPAPSATAATVVVGAATSVGSFLLHYDGLGCFPRIRDPRVIWAGLKTDTNNLVDLHQKLNAATQAIGQPPEDRPFKAHLTIARVKNLERKFIPALEAGLDSTEFSGPGEWLVKEVLLMQSHLSPKGARYEALHTVQLK